MLGLALGLLEAEKSSLKVTKIVTFRRSAIEIHCVLPSVATLFVRLATVAKEARPIVGGGGACRKGLLITSQTNTGHMTLPLCVAS